VKALPSSLVISLLICGASGAQAQKASNPQSPGANELKKALNAVMAQATPPPKTKDNDQGDDRASDRAKDRVCTKDTPAARRSAICPISPP
jgi:hypothetical protein